jgi:predicted transcriptional regulator
MACSGTALLFTYNGPLAQKGKFTEKDETQRKTNYTITRKQMEPQILKVSKDKRTF